MAVGMNNNLAFTGVSPRKAAKLVDDLTMKLPSRIMQQGTVTSRQAAETTFRETMPVIGNYLKGIKPNKQTFKQIGTLLKQKVTNLMDAIKGDKVAKSVDKAGFEIPLKYLRK